MRTDTTRIVGNSCALPSPGTSSLRGRSDETAGVLEDLCRRGDWACAAGDLAALADVASELAGAVPEPLHCELVALAEVWRRDPARAVAEWHRLRELVDETTTPQP